MLKKLKIKYRIIDLNQNFTVKGVNVGFGRRIKQNEIKEVLESLGKCLDLLERYLPQKFNDMTRDVKKIYVTRKLKALDATNPSAIFISEIKSIEVPINLFISEIEYKYRIEYIASLFLHEAQHARLHRLGFDSNRDMLGREERLCYTLQRRFGCKLKNGSEIVKFCDVALSVDLEKYYSTEAFITRQIKALESRDVPNWIKKYGTRIFINKYKKLNNIKKDGAIDPDLEKWNHY